MSELQRLSTEVEVSPLMRTHGGLALSQEGRQSLAAVRRAVADGVDKTAKIAVARHVALEAMDAVTDVDNYRKALAGNDQVLNAVLNEVELTFVQQLNRIQRGLL